MLPGTTLAAPTSTPPWRVDVGAQKSDTDAGRQANFFFNRDITIKVGDTVQWTQAAEEIHTVTFLAGTPRPELFDGKRQHGHTEPGLALGASGNPDSFDGTAPVNSGLLAVPGQLFKMTFAKAGD